MLITENCKDSSVSQQYWGPSTCRVWPISFAPYTEVDFIKATIQRQRPASRDPSDLIAREVEEPPIKDLQESVHSTCGTL